MPKRGALLSFSPVMALTLLANFMQGWKSLQWRNALANLSFS
jgi:hypothetical protein